MSSANTPKDVEKEQYQCVRAGFIAQGTTLTSWCRANGTRIQNVRAVFLGNWQGRKAKALKERVLAAADGSR